MIKELEEMKKMFEEMKKDLKEMEKEYEEDEDEEDEEESQSMCLSGNCFILATDQGMKVGGTTPQLLTLLTKIVESLNKEAKIEKDILQKAFDFAFMDGKELKKEMLKTIREFLEKAEKEESEEDDE